VIGRGGVGIGVVRVTAVQRKKSSKSKEVILGLSTYSLVFPSVLYVRH